MNDAEVAFKSAFGSTFRLFLIIVVLVALGTAFRLLNNDAEAGQVLLAVVIASAAGLGLSALAVAGLSALFKVYVSPTGLRSYDFWGKYHTVPWRDVEATEPASLGWLRYLKLMSPNTPRPVWVPLFLENQETFNRLVAEYAGPQHPLTQALEAEAEGK